jgi:hypothetical protein
MRRLTTLVKVLRAFSGKSLIIRAIITAGVLREQRNMVCDEPGFGLRPVRLTSREA